MSNLTFFTSLLVSSLVNSPILLSVNLPVLFLIYLKFQAVCKSLRNVYFNPIKTFFINTTTISSHFVNSVVAYNNNFPINPTIPSISFKPIINTFVKSLIPLDLKSDISIHKYAIPGTLATP